MASDSVTLALDGDPTLTTLVTALGALRNLLDGLAEDVADSLTIPWVVSDLEVGSAIATFTGRTEDTAALHAVTSAYLEIGQDLALGRRPPRGQRAIQAADEILRLIDNDVLPAITFETEDDEVILRRGSRLQSAPLAVVPGATAPAFGAVRGRVQTLSNRGGLRFTLYDQVRDRAVSCYLRRGQEDVIRSAWGRLVTVEGWIRRDPVTNQPRTVRQVEHVDIEREPDPGGWRRARGALHLTTDEPAEALIRQLRDA